MKFIVSSKTLYSALQKAARVISNKNALPILDCFKLGLQGNSLRIAAADHEMRLSTKVDVENPNGNGEICINAKNLTDALKELPDQPLTFDIDDSTKEILIHYHNGKYNFVGQSADEYPIPKELDKTTRQQFAIEAHTLEKVISETLFAVADDELRPVMNNVYFDITPEDVTFVGSDGHRLIRIVSNDTKGESRSSFLLPKKAANLLKALLPKQSDPVKVRYDLNNVVFDLTDLSITARMCEGRYPNYNSVIRQNSSLRVELSRDVLMAMVKRVSVFGNKASNLVKFSLSPNKLTVSAQDIDFSTSAEETTDIDYGGQDFTIGFKSTFLIELLANMPTSDIEIQMADASKAAVIVPTQNMAGYNHLSLLMPMQLND